MKASEVLAAASEVMDRADRHYSEVCSCCNKTAPLFALRDWAWMAPGEFVGLEDVGRVAASLALDGLRCEDLP